MQSLVMDGVRRTSTSRVRPQALVLAPRIQRPTPLSQNSVGAPSLDGVRRIPTPREMLESNQVTEPETIIPEVTVPTRSFNRPLVGFSLVASALIVAGVTGSHLLPVAAASDTVVQASTKAATAASNSLSPAPAKVAATAPAADATAQAIVDSFIAAHGSQYTVYVKDLKTGKVASSNADRVMLSASLYKLFVAQRVYQMVDNGQLSYGQKAGNESGWTIDACLKPMINISDNACGHDLGETIGWSKQDEALRSAGFSGTTLGDGDNPQLTNAKDVGTLFERLYSGTSMSPNATQRFLDLLKDQRVNDRLPSGLPAGTTVAHKTGDLQGYTHDAGIVYGAKTDFVVVVMSGPWASPENSKPAFGELAGKLNSYFNI